ncbi:PTS beta-glucoside transporter subunit IIBCA [Sesbania bispinosa]|nr:PTS beta-glucoside transporter subunit IIBCA [Sesbania bispinosa]
MKEYSQGLTQCLNQKKTSWFKGKKGKDLRKIPGGKEQIYELNNEKGGSVSAVKGRIRNENFSECEKTEATKGVFICLMVVRYDDSHPVNVVWDHEKATFHEAEAMMKRTPTLLLPEKQKQDDSVRDNASRPQTSIDKSHVQVEETTSTPQSVKSEPTTLPSTPQGEDSRRTDQNPLRVGGDGDLTQISTPAPTAETELDLEDLGKKLEIDPFSMINSLPAGTFPRAKLSLSAKSSESSTNYRIKSLVNCLQSSMLPSELSVLRASRAETLSKEIEELKLLLASKTEEYNLLSFALSKRKEQ